MKENTQQQENTTTEKDVLLSVENLSIEFLTMDGVHKAVRDVSFSVKRGEALGIVGESGSGKSVTSLAVMRLLACPPGKITSGKILFEGKDILSLRDEIYNIRGNEISMIFQEPMTSLNPIMTCGEQVMEPLILHHHLSKEEARQKAIEVMKLVNIPLAEQRMNEYPHQLSGGMRQRVMIAMALICQPKLLIADEPTTALDVTIQAQILDLIKSLRKEIDSSIIMITHDLGVIAELCDRVMVMYAGQVVEISPLKELFKQPFHPYSEGLLKSIPRITKTQEKLESIPGTVPSPYNMPKGCTFAPRCKYARERCHQECPELVQVDENRSVRCWYWQENAKRATASGKEG